MGDKMFKDEYKEKTDQIIAEAKQFKIDNNILYVEEQKTKFVIFILSDNYYAFRADFIKEILIVPKITYVPSSPQYIRGIISLRGDIESVIDISTLIALPEIELNEQCRLVIAQISDQTNTKRTGLLLTKLIDVLDIDNNKILPPLDLTSNSEFVEGGIYYDDKYVIILDLEKIFHKISA
ncbi:MAG: purine-binding chemotaxis protein CheW [Nitrospirae bacterium]|nr:purine-binding chemotaxis protein CheW [Nitrospirota bacterium]